MTSRNAPKPVADGSTGPDPRAATRPRVPPALPPIRMRIPALTPVAVLVLALALALAQPADAGPVYKAVDAQGNVTYSARPPVGEGQHVEEIEIRGEHRGTIVPTLDEGRDGARQRRGEAVSAAQQALIRAKAALEQAKIQDKGDWDTQSDGRRVLSAAYFSRVSAAEAQVQSAERALSQARRGP